MDANGREPQALASLSESRNPARDGAAVFVVRRAELAMERGFLVENDKEIDRQAEERRISNQQKSMKPSSFAQDHEPRADIHRIAHITVQAADGVSSAQWVPAYLARALRTPMHS